MEKEQLKKLVLEQLQELRKKQGRAWITHFKEGDFAKYIRNLPDTPDHILVILKGHLLVEQEINHLLEAKLPNPDAINLWGEHGPRFSHKLSLLRALITKPKHVPDI